MWDPDDPSLYNSEHLVVRHLYDSTHASVVWFGFTRGQVLRDHETTSTAIIEVLKGRIRLQALDDMMLQAGQGVLLEPNIRHALTALDDAVVQLMLVPHPQYHSLSQEVGLGSDTR